MDYTNLFSSRKDRLVYQRGEGTGKSFVSDLKDLSRKGVLLSAVLQLAHFVRDDLLEPADSVMALSIYRHEQYRPEGAAWPKETDPARAMGLLDWVRSGHEASSFPAPSGLDGLRYQRRHYGTKSA